MKKLLPIILLTAFLSGGVVAQEPADVNIVINNAQLAKDPPPVKVAGQTLLPLRSVFNALGAEVKFENKVITARLGAKEVIMSPNVKAAKIDGKDVELEVPPMLFNGTTYVPLRIVASALGSTVAFDAATKTINVGPAEEPIDVPPERLELLKGRLKQLVVGNQGAILKVRDYTGSTEVYYRGLDDRDTAPYSPVDQESILASTEFATGLQAWLDDTFEGFRVLPKREAIAFMGMVYSIPDESSMDPGDVTDRLIREFLLQVVQEDPDVVLRRQAVLSMAVGEFDPQFLEAVLHLYESSENLWETFPVQQYFQYHAETLRTQPNFSTIRARAAAVNSLYTENILRYLDGQ